MIDLYTWSTPNGRKASIMLEEVGLAYTVHSIDIMKDEQFAPGFLKISPNNKIPAIVDHDAVDAMDGGGAKTLFESGAILMYLARKSGKLWPREGAAKWQVMEWLMWQVGGLGPMLGQAHHFIQFNPGKSEYAERRYGSEARRLYGVLDRALADTEFVAGDYSIADIAIWPWVSRFPYQKIDLNDFENVKRWYLTIAARDAVKKGHDVPVQAEIPMP